jgi:hypothetical protein
VRWADYLIYDAETGVLSWRVKRPGPTTAIGQQVGSVKHDGRYRTFVLFHKRYYTHRVIWELVNGPIPDGMCIDHIDGNGLNNRLSNLRLTTLSGNQRNRRVSKNNRTGITGVFHHGNGKGFNVTCAGRYIGYFTDLTKAAAARKAAEAINGYHPNHGRKHHASS